MVSTTDIAVRQVADQEADRTSRLLRHGDYKGVCIYINRVQTVGSESTYFSFECSIADAVQNLVINLNTAVVSTVFIPSGSLIDKAL